jgi:predicted metal-dependent phosphotriesterase family hydrolase
VIVRTVLGDIAPETLGLTLGHEHVFARPPDDVTDPDLRLDDEEKSARELVSFRQAGGGAVVDMTTRDYGNDAAALARASQASGVHVIAATGFNKGRFADRLSSGMTTVGIADFMTREVRYGIADTIYRAGLIKASSSLDGANENERRVFEAAAEAHAATGAPISTHTEKGTWAEGQIALLTDLGVPPDRILIGHLDLKPDLAYLREVAASGVFMGFDQFSKEKYLADAARIELIAELVADGHGGQIIVSGDLARRSYLAAWGGEPGYRYFLADLPGEFAMQGIDRTLYEGILRDNPRRFLAFDPRS